MSVSLSTDNYKNLNDALDRLLEAGEKRQMQPDDVQRGILLLWTKVQSEARNPYGLLVKGRLEMYQGGLEEALVTLRQAIAIDANLHPAMTIAGLLLMKAGKKEKALAMMKQAEQAAVEQGADEETLTKCLLDVALAQQHIPALREAAEATIRSAVAIHPSVLEGHLRLAGLLSDQGRNEEEIECLSLALAGATVQVANDDEGTTTNGVVVSSKHDNILLGVGVQLGKQQKWDVALKACTLANEAHVAGVQDEKESMEWFFIAKIVQCHQALGNIEHRNAKLGELYRLHQEDKVPSDRFCREQIQTQHGNIMAFEFFRQSGKFGEFLIKMKWEGGPPVAGAKEPELNHIVTLGSYDQTTNISRELGKTLSTHRIYHIDTYHANGEHKTLKMFDSDKRPSYDQVRNIMLGGMVGQVKSLSSCAHPRALLY